MHKEILGSQLERAEHLLRTGDMPVADVARESGFASVQYFCRLFHQRKRCPPADTASAMGPGSFPDQVSAGTAPVDSRGTSSTGIFCVNPSGRPPRLPGSNPPRPPPCGSAAPTRLSARPAGARQCPDCHCPSPRSRGTARPSSRAARITPIASRFVHRHDRQGLEPSDCPRRSFAALIAPAQDGSHSRNSEDRKS